MQQSTLQEAVAICKHLHDNIPGCIPCLVGGCVRDLFFYRANDWAYYLDNPEDGLIKDVDIEVFKATPEKLIEVLQQKYTIDLVGKSFGVLKVKGWPIDISIPRRERQVGTSHKDFAVDCDPNMSFKEACERRDFTVNAILLNPLSKGIIDPFHGISHLRDEVLYPISDRFCEDPLRVLRAMQFIARFGFAPSDKLIEMSRSMQKRYFDLPKERIREEWNKMMLRGTSGNMSKALNFLDNSGWLHNIPELEVLKTIEQDPEWHPEGDVWIHTQQALDVFPFYGPLNDEDALAIGYAILLHDIGKSITTSKNEEGRIIAHGHDKAGIPLAHAFLTRLFDPKEKIVDLVTKLVGAHMRVNAPYHSKSLSAVRRLSMAVNGRLDLLACVAKCDIMGCGNRQDKFVPIDWLLEKAKELNIKSTEPQPIVMGRHLIEHFQLTPGKQFGPILAGAFEAQLDGKFDNLESGLAYVKANLLQPA